MHTRPNHHNVTSESELAVAISGRALASGGVRAMPNLALVPYDVRFVIEQVIPQLARRIK